MNESECYTQERGTYENLTKLILRIIYFACVSFEWLHLKAALTFYQQHLTPFAHSHPPTIVHVYIEMNKKLSVELPNISIRVNDRRFYFRY